MVLIDPGAPIEGLTDKNQSVKSVLEFMQSIMTRAAEPGDTYAALYLGNQARTFDNALILEVQASEVDVLELPPTPIPQSTAPTPKIPTPINTPGTTNTPTHQELEATGFPVRADHQGELDKINKNATATQAAYILAATATQDAYTVSATQISKGNNQIDHDNECANQSWALNYGDSERIYNATLDASHDTFMTAIVATQNAHATQLPITVTAQVAKLLTAIPPQIPPVPPPNITLEQAMSSADVYDGLGNASALFRDRCKTDTRCILIIFDQMVDWRDNRPKVEMGLQGVEIAIIFPQCKSESTPKCTALAAKWEKEFKDLGSTNTTHNIQKNAETTLLHLLNPDKYP